MPNSLQQTTTSTDDAPIDVVDVARRALAAAVLVRPELADVEHLLEQMTATTMSPAAAALDRLVAGDGTTADVRDLTMPLTGARIVVVAVDDVNARSELLSLLAAERDALAIRRDAKLVALARHVPHGAGEDKGLRTARRLALTAVRHQPKARVGISAAVNAAGDLAVAVRDASDAADLAASAGNIVCVDDAWAQVVVTRVRRHLPDCLTSSHPLARLLAYDRRHRSDLGKTVATWLAMQQDTPATAAALSVHPNTLRYRLRRAQDVSGLDLSDEAHVLAAHLVLRPAPRRGVGE